MFKPVLLFGFLSAWGVLIVHEQDGFAAGFNLTSKVGAGRSDGDTLWACVIQDSTHIRCAHSATNASAMTWCDAHALAAGKVVSTSDSGVYLVPGFEEQTVGGKHITEMAFFVQSSNSTAGTYTMHALALAIDAVNPDCVYLEADNACPRVGTGMVNPDLSPRLGVTGQLSNTHINVFSISTSPVAGGICGFDVAGSGLGAWTALYTAGTKGIIPATTVNAGPIHAVISPLTGDSIVAVQDSNSASGKKTFSRV